MGIHRADDSLNPDPKTLRRRRSFNVTVQLTVLGSGDAFNSAGRGNAGYLLNDGAGAICVDFGPTALLKLRTCSQTAPNDIDAIFLTHLHGDHFGGIHLFLVDADFPSRRTKPLVICGPRGTAETVSRWYELAFGAVPSSRHYEIRYVEMEPGETREILGRRVSAFPARHMGEGDIPLAFRLDMSGGGIGISGDTVWTESLIEAARGTDIFICDCTGLSGNSPQHLTWEALRPRRSSLDTRLLLLSHLGSEMRQAADSLSEEGVLAADDGMILEVRDGSVTWKQPNRG